MYNSSNSSPFIGEQPIPFIDLPDLVKWGIASNPKYDYIRAIRCYNLDAVAIKFGIKHNCRTLASPDALFITELGYVFVELKSIKALGSTNMSREEQKYVQKLDPIEFIEWRIRNLLFKHLAPKIAGAAMFAAITSTELHFNDYWRHYHNDHQLIRLYFVLDDADKAASMSDIFSKVEEDFGSFGISFKIRDINTFIREDLPAINSVLA